MEEIYKIWFSKLDIKNKTKMDLLENYSAEEIWNMDFVFLLDLFIEESEIVKILKDRNLEQIKRELDYMKRKGIKLISFKDEIYPRKLHNISDKPAFLYIRGNEDILDDDSVRDCWM